MTKRHKLLTQCVLSYRDPSPPRTAHAVCYHPIPQYNSNNLQEFLFSDTCFSEEKKLIKKTGFEQLKCKSMELGVPFIVSTQISSFDI